MQSEATNVGTYLEQVSEKWCPIVAQLRRIVLANLRDGFDEVVNWGMLTYEVPLATSGKTYNGKPLMYVAIGAQKNHVGLYLCGLYCHAPLLEQFTKAYDAAGTKLDMGKACVRIKREDQIVEQAVADAVAAFDAKEYVEVTRK